MPGPGIGYVALDRENESKESIALRNDSPVEKLIEEGEVLSSDEETGPWKKQRNWSILQFLRGTRDRSLQKQPRGTAGQSKSARRLWQIFGQSLAPSRRTALLLVFVAVVLILSILTGGAWVYKSAPQDGLSPPWYPAPIGGTINEWQDSYRKARQMVAQMSLVEKVNITTGTGWSMDMCVGNTGVAESVGFPSLCLQDGPLGLRFADHATSFPAGITLGATWSAALMRAHGEAHAREAKLKGINVLLGPTMGPLGRNPAGGRNWEGVGADPVLQATAAHETIQGIQGEGIMATAKHYVGNEQEHFRKSFEWGLPHAMSSNLDDRTLHELYAWPFAESIRAGVVSVMCSYQMVNNSYACANSKLLNGILKDEMDFQGFVQSDWLAQRSGVASALAGLDMSMPGDGLRWMDGKPLYGDQLTIAVLNHSVPLERLDDMATRIIAAWYQVGQDQWEKPPPHGKGGPNFSSWTDERVGLLHPASNSTETGIVNQFVNAQGGTTNDPPHKILARRIAAEGTVLVKNDNVLPLSRDSKSRIAIVGEDAGPGRGPNVCEDRSCNQGTLASGWGSGATEFPYLVDPASAMQYAIQNTSATIDTFLHNDLSKDDLQELEVHDTCIVFANSDAGEGYLAWNEVRGDRNNLELQKGGDPLILATAKHCGGPVLVVIHAVGPVIVEKWADLPEIRAILLANLPGQESGNALVDVIFGDVDASGRLPYTVGKSLDDYGDGAQILYYPNSVVPQVTFKETLYVDYRHFDQYDIEPRYEFGFGLSYTLFNFSDLEVKTILPKSALPVPWPRQTLSSSASALAADGGSSHVTNTAEVPDPSSALFPPGFRRLKNYIYPWIESTDLVQHGRYPYPEGYTEHPHDPSPAGGGQGGNPDLFTTHVEVSLRISNTGHRSGKEVVQVYVSYPEGVTEPDLGLTDDTDSTSNAGGTMIDFPPKSLRAFHKTDTPMEPGESRVVTLNLTRKDLSYWSTRQQNWVMPVEGKFGIHVGRSSRDLRLHGEY